MRLNIPLSTHSRTRLSTSSRRVLWLALVLFFFALITIILTNLWVNRDSLSSFAPEETLVTIHLTPNQKQWTNLINDFGNLPLISERSLTIKDLSDFKIKELSIFVLTNNRTAIAVRTGKQSIPQDLISFLDLNNKKLNSNSWFLSSEDLNPSNINKTKINFSSLWSNNIGSIITIKKTGAIYLQKNGYFFKEENEFKNQDVYLPTLPSKTIAAVALENQNIDLLNLFNQFKLILKPLEIIKDLDFWQNLEKNKTLVLLAKSEEKPGTTNFLIQTQNNSSLVSQIILASAALQTPIIKKTSFPDGSLAEEIIIDPSQIKSENVIISGQDVQKIKTENGEILALIKENNSIISSNEKLLEDYLYNQNLTTKNQTICGSEKNLVFFDINNLDKSAVLNDFYQNQFFVQAISKFNNFIVTKKGFLLCN